MSSNNTITQYRSKFGRLKRVHQFAYAHPQLAHSQLAHPQSLEPDNPPEQNPYVFSTSPRLENPPSIINNNEKYEEPIRDGPEVSQKMIDNHSHEMVEPNIRPLSSRERDNPARNIQFYLPDHCEVYTVAYNSPERAAQMTERFANIGLPLNVHIGVQMDDSRLQFAGDDMSAKRLASVFYGHLDNIANFYKTGKPFGLFCEDDVHIHKDLGKELPIMMGEFNAMQLDILLLGYMTTKTIEWWQQGYPLVYDGAHAPYRYHRYPQDQWGIHLFMISRSYAKTLLEVYGPDYAAKSYKDVKMTCCNPDWTLSKHTSKRALRYPMLAVEDGKGNYDHHGQGEFHRESHRINYREEEFY